MKSYALPFLAALVGVAAGDGLVPAPQDYVPVTAAPASMEKRDCAADNCLRAVRASAFPTRLGSVDCSSYFLTTITPATSTVYATLSFYTSPTTTQDVTATTTLAVTATETDEETLTAATVTTTQYVPVPPPVVRKERRQQTVIPNAIPSYASACSGAVRYSSACSCVGVTASTTYAPTPVTTVTVSSTYTPTTVTVLTTVQTETGTMTVATETVTTTDATVTPVATASVEGLFYIQVQSGGAGLQGMYAENQWQQDPPYSEFTTMNFVASTTDVASTFYIDASGYLRPSSAPEDDMYFIYQDTGFANTVFEWGFADSISFNYAIMHCSITPGTNVLACGSESTKGANTFSACNTSGLTFFGPASVPACSNALVLVAVPASS